jgi:hypothetical protein
VFFLGAGVTAGRDRHHGGLASGGARKTRKNPPLCANVDGLRVSILSNVHLVAHADAQAYAGLRSGDQGNDLDRCPRANVNVSLSTVGYSAFLCDVPLPMALGEWR